MQTPKQATEESPKQATQEKPAKKKDPNAIWDEEEVDGLCFWA